MSINIRKMTGKEFLNFHQWSIAQQAKELTEERHISPEEAMKEAIKEVASMLPDGLNTEHNYLMTIIEEDCDEIVGFIWTLHEETTGRKQCFVCDFTIWEPKRRKGYATAALRLTETYAAAAGCQEIVLFVADRNHAANALYEKCGYHCLRQEGYGKYMAKALL